MTDRVGTPEARHAVISRLLAERGRLDVAEVADLLGVAQETVRRDLRSLESAGVLRRVHGGAIPAESESRVPIPTLAPPPPHEAALACRLWAELPRSGTILLGTGALTLAVTHAIMTAAPEAPGLTLVTNSLDAAVHLARLSKLSVYNIGGTVSHQTRAQEGDWALEELSRLHVDIALLCPAGVTVEHGLSESTPAAAAIAQAELACAASTIALCPAEVLGRSAFVSYAALTDIGRIMVSGRPDPLVVQRFRDVGTAVDLVAVSAATPDDEQARAG
jgi:DeoR/GlpR family transcriptional regulator of sugar metabolism